MINTIQTKSTVILQHIFISFYISQKKKVILKRKNNKIIGINFVLKKDDELY